MVYNITERQKLSPTILFATVPNDEQKQIVIERIQSGASISAIAREYNTTRQTILRIKESFNSDYQSGTLKSN